MILAYAVVAGCTASGSISCKKTDYHEEKKVRHDDGTVTKDSKTVESDRDGNVKKTEEHKVDR